MILLLQGFEAVSTSEGPIKGGPNKDNGKGQQVKGILLDLGLTVRE